MRRISMFGIALVAMLISCSLFGQDVKVDLTEIDTGIVILKMATEIDTAVTDSVVRVPVSVAADAGTMEVQMKFDSSAHSIVKFDVSETGEISNVLWKPDNRDTTQYQPLDTARYDMKSANKEIKLKYCNFFLGTEMMDVGDYQLEYYDPVARSSTNYGNPDSVGKYSIFPGNYLLSSTATNSAIGFLLRDDCYVDPVVSWRPNDDPTAAWERLHIETYDVSGVGILELRGAEIDLKVNLAETQTATLLGMQPDKVDLADESSNVRRLMPGSYILRYFGSIENGLDLQLKVLNKTARLSPDIYWKDANGEQTAGVFAMLEKGWVYVTPQGISAGELPPPADEEEPQNDYAVLKDKLDGSYYISRNNEFWLRYDERYNESADLNLRILDMQYNEIPLSSPVTRHYGTNWIKLQLSGGFNVGEYYVLEVRSEKGDLSMLRFRYEK